MVLFLSDCVSHSPENIISFSMSIIGTTLFAPLNFFNLSRPCKRRFQLPNTCRHVFKLMPHRKLFVPYSARREPQKCDYLLDFHWPFVYPRPTNGPNNVSMHSCYETTILVQDLQSSKSISNLQMAIFNWSCIQLTFSFIVAKDCLAFTLVSATAPTTKISLLVCFMREEAARNQLEFSMLLWLITKRKYALVLKYFWFC